MSFNADDTTKQYTPSQPLHATTGNYAISFLNFSLIEFFGNQRNSFILIIIYFYFLSKQKK